MSESIYCRNRQPRVVRYKLTWDLLSLRIQDPGRLISHWYVHRVAQGCTLSGYCFLMRMRIIKWLRHDNEIPQLPR
jgi:hypothetical protein